MNDYSDIINTKWPRESNPMHPRMKLKDRAKIFLPFAALRGYNEAIQDVTDFYDSDKNTGYDENKIYFEDENEL